VPRNRGGRYDDPLGQYWTYYAAEQRIACFAEVLAQFRTDLTMLAALADLGPAALDDPLPATGIVPDDWHLKRVIASFSLTLGQPWLDLRRFETREHLRRELANILVRLGYGDFDLGDALSRDRRLTQTISRWAYDNG
jgi:hypothetical protein